MFMYIRYNNIFYITLFISSGARMHVFAGQDTLNRQKNRLWVSPNQRLTTCTAVVTRGDFLEVACTTQ